MDLHVALTDGADLTAQIYTQIRDAVLDGRLAPGARVPATRELALSLRVSRGTVSEAYDRLVAEELLTARRGSGTYVPTGAISTTPRGRPTARAGAVQPLPLWGAGPTLSTQPGRAAYDFSLGFPDPALFPLPVWRRLVSARLRNARMPLGTYDGGALSEADPSPTLPAEIARYVGLSRSVVAAPSDVVVTAGAQQALDLVARVLVEPGDVVAVEDPGYTAVHRLLETHRAVVRGVPVDGEGLVVDALPERARLVYVTPSHQFPLGVAMSRRRRVALLEWASRVGAVVVEDDYDSEFRHGARPLEPLQSLDREGRVVYIGSFSKSLLPALRVGYAIAPRSLQDSLREALRVTVWGGDATTHGALADFLAQGHHAAHVKRARRVYRERRAVLLEGLTGQGSGLADALEVIPSAAGLHVCTLLRAPWPSDVSICESASAAGVFVEPLSLRFRDQPVRQGLGFGFGAITAEAIPEALRRLDTAIHGRQR